MADIWTPTRAAGLAQLDDFAPRMGRFYTNRRNTDAGWDSPTTSRLSPWLRHRLIDEREVLEKVMAHGGYEGCEKFVHEVFWRGYFKGWLEQRPVVWSRYVAQCDKAFETLTSDRRLRLNYEKAIGGRSGIAVFDHWADELVETGWLHNHARMWFASIWVFTLELPWELGADWFLRHLVDGDPASNTLSWRWVSGLHTRGKSYLADADNIRKFTNDRFHPKGELADTVQVPEDPEPGSAQSLPDAGDMPGGAAWLMLTDDLAGGYGDAPVLALPAGAPRGDEPTGDLAAAFEAGALDDAIARHGTDRAVGWSAREIHRWAVSKGCEALAVWTVPQGPVRDRFAPLAAELGALGLPVTEIRRPYDSAVWPHTKKGFFALKKQIPGILSELEL